MTFRVQIPEFQSLTGRLKTKEHLPQLLTEFLFQSLTGRLKTKQYELEWCHVYCFNPSQVG